MFMSLPSPSSFLDPTRIPLTYLVAEEALHLPSYIIWSSLLKFTVPSVFQQKGGGGIVTGRCMPEYSSVDYKCYTTTQSFYRLNGGPLVGVLNEQSLITVQKDVHEHYTRG